MPTAICAILTAVFLLGSLSVVSGDPWKDESGHGYWRGGHYPHGYFVPGHRAYKQHDKDEYKETFRYGNCKIEREWKSDGSYKEEIDCD